VEVSKPSRLIKSTSGSSRGDPVYGSHLAHEFVLPGGLGKLVKGGRCMIGALDGFIEGSGGETLSGNSYSSAGRERRELDPTEIPA